MIGKCNTVNPFKLEGLYVWEKYETISPYLSFI